MPNYHDHESNHSQRHEGRLGKSSGWRSARGERGDGYRHRDDRRDGYKRNSSERADGSKRYWDSERNRDGHDSYRGGDRERRGEYKRRDDRRSWNRDDRRRDDNCRWDRDDRGRGSRDAYKRDDRRDGYKRRDDRGRDDRRSWNRDDRRDDRHEEERGRRWDRSERSYSRDGYGRGDRDGYKRRDDRGRDDRRSWNRDDRRSSGRGFDRDFNRGNNRPRRDAGFDDGYRNVRGGEEKRARAKELQREIPESITPDMLPEQTYNHLRGLNKDNAQMVARHLAYAAEMLDIDPEVSYQHSKAAYARAARIDIVREALGIAAYVTGRYAEALTELRAYRRFSNDYSHVAMEADSERGLGRSEKALRFIADIPLDRLDPSAKVELAIVTSGAKADMGDSEGGLRLMEKIIVKNLSQELAARVELVKADRLEELGRLEEAQAIRAQWEPVYSGSDKDSDILLDLADVYGDAAYGDAEADAENSETDEIISADDIDSADTGDSPESAESPDSWDETQPVLSDNDTKGADSFETAEADPSESDEPEHVENLDDDLDPNISLEDELKEELGDDFLAEEWAEEFSDASYSDASDDERDDAPRAEEA